MKKVLLSWSSGKDSAYALHVLRKSEDCEVAALLTTVNETHERVAMHAVRRTLLQAQAEAVGVPLWEAPIPYPCSNEQYESVMTEVMARAEAEGFTHVAFGDLFLEDIRAYRVEKLAKTKLEPLFPVWGIPTDSLAQEMLAVGMVAHLTAVDPRCLDAKFAGRQFSEELLGELPAGTDPCGERGEFHTFVSAGPMFRYPLQVEVGPVVERDGFVFADVRLQADPAA